MPLRVTSGMMSTQLMRNLNSNMNRMDSLQNQLSTGRKILKPSDDPVGITYSLRYRSELNANEQYQGNIGTTSSWLDFCDTTVGQATDVIHRLKELTVKASTGTNPQQSLDAINKEVKELRGQLVDIGNSKLNGKYIYNGQQTDKQPYQEATASMDVTDGQPVVFDLSAGVKMPVNYSGNEIFGAPSDNDNIFRVIDDLSAALASGNFDNISTASDRIDTRFDKVSSIRAEIGARTNRTDLMDNRLKDLGINLTGLQSKVEDADYDELIIKSKINENVYQASLSVGAKIITPSLVDFLR